MAGKRKQLIDSTLETVDVINEFTEPVETTKEVKEPTPCDGCSIKKGSDQCKPCINK
jgi:hypothetical protein